MAVNDGEAKAPAGTKEVKSPKFAPESFVTATDDPVAGEVLIAVTGTFYLVEFDDEPDGELEWVPESELVASNVTESDVEEAAEKAKNGTMVDRVNYAQMKKRLPSKGQDTTVIK